MRYFIYNIVRNIEKQLDENTARKVLVKIDSFETPQLYWELWKEIKKLTDKNDINLIYKLSDEKYTDFASVGENEYVLKEMMDNLLIANGTKLTNFRNQIPNKRTLIVLLGTEISDESGSLADFYTINVQSIEAEIKDEYCKLFERFSCMSEEANQIINNLYKDIFRYVPKNLYKLSCLVDRLEGSYDDVEEMIYDICMNLADDWGLVNIIQSRPTCKELLRGKKIQIFQQADKFLKRKGFDKLSEVRKYEKRINDFIDIREKNREIWPENYEIKSYNEFRDTLISYMQGIDVGVNRDKLAHIDFSYICEAMNFKVIIDDDGSDKETKNSIPKFSDEPIITLSKAIIDFLGYLERKECTEFEELNFKINSIGISQVINEPEMYLTWKNICYVTGGIIPFINREEILLDEENVLRIVSDKEYFDFSNSSELYEEGILKRLNSLEGLCKISFEIAVCGGKYKKEYVWKFDPKDDWVLLFQDLDQLENIATHQSSFIPFGINDKLPSLLEVRNTSEFYENYNNQKVNYDQYDIIDQFEKLYGQKYKEYFIKIFKLGEAFSKWVIEMKEGGIFSTLSTSTYQLIDSYNTYAETLLENTPTEEFEQSYKLFVNAFIISNNSDPIIQDIDVDIAIVPPYHPAVVEKLLYRIDYIKWGLHQIIKEFITSADKNKVRKSCDSIDRLLELSVIDSAVDILISGSKYITKNKMYGYYTTYCNHNKKVNDNNVLVDMMQRDGIFSEDFSTAEYKKITPLAKIIKNNICNYLNVFPIAYHSLEVVVINFDDFQDVVSGIHNLIAECEKDKQELKEVKLSILMPTNQQGGQNYLAYWVNSFFDEDSNVKIKIYLNYYKDTSELNSLIPETTDLVFYNDLLKEVNVTFSRNEMEEIGLTETRFPMVYRALPISTSSKKRQIEITQTQFKAATNHAQVVFKAKNMAVYNNTIHRVVREMEMDNDSSKILEELHEKCKWVVCIGMGLDKKLLLNDEEKEFKIIGFTTGEGTYGEYNVTTSACLEMVDDLKSKLLMKFRRIFCKSSENEILSAVDFCIKKIKYLDGVNILKALNPHDYDINNFIAYLLTNKYFVENEKNQDGINIIISLDSYRHWFDCNQNLTTYKNSSRPDFLQLSIDKIDDSKPICIQANIIECKFAKENSSHVDKAYDQVTHGYEVLDEIFDPNMRSIEKRYWFAQLYRVLTFSEINMMDNDTKFSMISDKLMRILDGEFEIEWSGSIMTYWVDSEINGIEKNSMGCKSVSIQQYIFGQKQILKYLSGNENLEVAYCDDIKLDLNDDLDESGEDESDESDELDEPIEKVDLNVLAFINEDDKKQTKERQGNEFSNIVVDTENPDYVQVAENKSHPIEDVVAKNIKIEESTDNLITENVTADYLECKEDVLVQLGTSFNQNERIDWNFKDPRMSNRHVLITGKSGQGKTYAIQGMFLELAMKDIPIIIFDYTGGFVQSKLEPEVQRRLEGKIRQQIVRKDKLKINPFKIQMMDIDGFSLPEDVVDVSERIKDILVHVYSFGDQQGAAIYMACKNGLTKHKEKMNFNYFKEELEELGTKEAKSVYNKIISFLDYDIFDTEQECNWDDILYNNGEVTVFQLSFVQSKDMQIAITEMILWDMWYYTVKNGKEAKPFAVVLDEAQNLSFGDKAPTTKILTEGRKFGWSGWFATQFLKGQLKPEEINRLQQAALRIYFKPADDEIQSMANSIDPEKKDISRWIKQLKKAQKGECVVIGDGVYGVAGKKTVPVTIKVPTIEERV